MYDICLSKVIYCLLFYFKTMLTPFFCQIYGISLTRIKEFRQYWPKEFESEKDTATEEWWRSKLLIDGFNAACKNIAASFMKFGNESMIVICFWATAKG